jgi:hypothetical protein
MESVALVALSRIESEASRRWSVDVAARWLFDSNPPLDRRETHRPRQQRCSGGLVHTAGRCPTLLRG